MGLPFKIGEEIGRTASIDLFEKVICRKQNKKLIPESIKAFIELFDYWDSSGGWGKLYYRDETNSADKTGKWTIVTKNNFLIDESGNQTEEEINHLYSFWKGYITGALNEALIRLSEIYSGLSAEFKRKVLFPPYTKIINVDRELDEKEISVDIFYVYFKKHPYGWAFEMLSNAKAKADVLEDEEGDKIFIFNQLFALLSNLKESSQEHYRSVISKLTTKEQNAIKNIEEHKHNKVETDVFQSIWLLNFIVQQFINF